MQAKVHWFHNSSHLMANNSKRKRKARERYKWNDYGFISIQLFCYIHCWDFDGCVINGNWFTLWWQQRIVTLTFLSIILTFLGTSWTSADLETGFVPTNIIIYVTNLIWKGLLATCYLPLANLSIRVPLMPIAIWYFCVNNFDLFVANLELALTLNLFWSNNSEWAGVNQAQ